MKETYQVYCQKIDNICCECPRFNDETLPDCERRKQRLLYKCYWWIRTSTEKRLFLEECRAQAVKKYASKLHKIKSEDKQLELF